VRWLKVPEAAKEWAGGVSPKTLYAAIRSGRLKAARIGAGRNVLLCEAFVDEWLQTSIRNERATEPAITLMRARAGSGG
jgi:excisionase family DNA binding protein